jgi:hypothetical protein
MALSQIRIPKRPKILQIALLILDLNFAKVVMKPWAGLEREDVAKTEVVGSDIFMFAEDRNR